MLGWLSRVIYHMDHLAPQPDDADIFEGVLISKGASREEGLVALREMLRGRRNDSGERNPYLASDQEIAVSRFDAVVFDLDNTLCRNTHDTTALYENAFERVGADPFGRPDDLWAALDGPPDPDDRIGYLGAGFARVASQHGRSDVDPVALASALTEVIDHTEVELLPGAAEALEAARASGPTGILTNGPQSRQEQKVRALSLDDAVDRIVYAGDLERRKPHVEPFEAMLDSLGVAPDRALYVGDSLAYDVAGAQNAGLSAAWLRGDGEDDEYDPEYSIDSLDDLTEILEQ